jgi:hypothetical protein
MSCAAWREPGNGACSDASDLRQVRRDPAQGLPDLAAKLVAGRRNEAPLRGSTGAMAMKLFVGLAVFAGAMIIAGAAGAQALPPYPGVSPYAQVSDFGGPYAEMPPEAMPPRYAPAPPLPSAMLPPREVYAMLRDSGFSPLGVLQLRGVVYTVAAVDPNGDDGRLVIDARNGRILRFTPAYRMGARMDGRMDDEAALSYGQPAPPQPMGDMRRGVPRPPAPVPHVASRLPAAAPLPKSVPPVAAVEPNPSAPVAAAPAPAAPVQQSASAQIKPATPPVMAPAPAETKPSAQILPTQQMPKVQGLD